MFRYGRGDPVVKPEFFAPDDAPKKALVTFMPPLYRYVLRLADRREPSGYIFSGRSVRAWFGNKEVLLVLSNPGSAIASSLIDVLAASGVEEVIVIGLAGSVSPAAKIGDVLIPSWGLREEGASYHYVPAPDYVPRPSQGLRERLTGALRRRFRGRVLDGGVWSTDAPFRETIDKVIEYSKKGILAVDMESTGIMTVADVRDVELAVALVISDELRHNGEWVPGFGEPSVRRGMRVCAKVGIDILTQERGGH